MTIESVVVFFFGFYTVAKTKNDRKRKIKYRTYDMGTKINLKLRCC